MSSRLDQALDEVIRDRKTERGNNNDNNNKKRNNNIRRENGGGGIRKRGGGGGGNNNNTTSSSPAIRSFVRTVNVMEERRGGASRNVNGQWSHDMFDDEDVPRSSILSRLGTARGGQGERVRGVEIYVENLHYNVTEEDVKELFNTVGDVTRAKLEFDQSGRSTGVARISYQSESDAKKAIDKYNGIKLDGQAMRIKMNERAAPKPRSSGGRFNNDRLSSRIGSRLGGSNDRRSNNDRDDRDDFRQKRLTRPNKPSKNSDKKNDRQKKVPTAEDLDREMESYMQTNAFESNNGNNDNAAIDEDIEMILD